MAEIDILKRAQEYMLSLARGFDPLTGEEIENDSVINNVRMSRCFFYVSDVLGKVIDNGGEVTKSARKSEPKPKYIPLTAEMIENYPYSENPVGISNLVKPLREMLGESGKPLSVLQITAWLVNEGYLIENIRSGKREKVATQKGNALGITVKEGVNPQTGVPYRMNLYNIKAQRFILENHNRMLEDLQPQEDEVCV